MKKMYPPIEQVNELSNKQTE